MPFDQVVLRGIYLTHSAHQRRIEIDRSRERDECIDIARQASPTIRAARAQKAGADPWIERQRAGDRIEIGAAEAIGELREKISEGNLRAKENVGGDFREFGIADR